MERRTKYLLEYVREFLIGQDSRPPRAPRFQHEGPLLFRQFGETEWSQGTTVNISRSGVAFRTDRMLQVRTPIQITFAPPPEVAGAEGAVAFCKGRIVRTVLPATSDGQPQLAARVLDYLPKTPLNPEAQQFLGANRATIAKK